MNVLNTTTLQNLLMLSSKNQAPLLNLLQGMIDNCTINISTLQHAFIDHDIETAYQLLHKIRGSFATIGAEAFAKKCAEIEQQLQANILPNQVCENEIYSLYQDSCSALQLFLRQQSTNAVDESIDIDFQQLLQLLEQKDMAATQLAITGTRQLKQLLTAQEVADFFHHLALLNFTAAATMLRPKVMPKHIKQRKGD